MAQPPIIHYTKKYNLFNTFHGNRAMSASHVQSMMEDPTFPEKLKLSPIIVSPSMHIIDGQHRWQAAKELNIDLYYIIDPTATEDDIRIRNQNMLRWSNWDFVCFYAEKKKSYKIIKELKEYHKVPLTVISSAIIKLGNFRRMKYCKDLKKGEVNFDKYENLIVDFINSYVPAIKKLRSMYVDSKIVRPLFTDAWICAFAHYFRDDQKIYEKALKNIFLKGMTFPYITENAVARDMLLKIAKWKSNDCNSNRVKI